jgi:uncharacterized protein (DUF342 family)
MITMQELRDYMNMMSEKELGMKSISASGDTLDEAIRSASIQLAIPVKKIEYEVLEKGNKGFAGAGKRKWVINAYPLAEKESIIVPMDFQASENKPDIGADEKKDANGEAFARLSHEGIFLKVMKAKGRGAPASDKDAFEMLHKRGISQYDLALVAKIVKRAEGKFIRIGEFDYNPLNDSTLTVDIADMEMRAYIELTPPRLGGGDLSIEGIVAMLNNNGIYYGILDNVLQDLENKPQYNMRILVAEGSKPVNGSDAKIEYHFNVSQDHVALKEEKDGRIDFKELNLIENVVAGQVLAKKIPQEKGTDGKTITGKSLPAKAGNDIQMRVGKNVKLSEDGNTAISEINGQVMIVGGKILVEPVYVVNGDVSLATGNILFLGTVIVKGNVMDGFSVKAAGNIEVKGNVGKSILDAEGDILVHNGVLGKNGGMVKSGKSIFSKFIEHAKVEAAEFVVVNEGILHSSVDANKKIICQGRRASIVGGKLRASEEINAKHLGSIAGTETILEVGYDPISKEKLGQLDKQKTEVDKSLEELELNIKTLLNLQKVQRKLSEEKQQALDALTKKRQEIFSNLERIHKEIDQIKAYLSSIKKEGRISASEKVFPGVKIYIKDSFLEVKNEFKFVTFILEHGNVRITKYEAVEEDFKRRIH